MRVRENKPAVVYLDDEEINLLLFREMFKKDFEVFTTTYPEEALEYLQSHDVEYIFTDQRMPIMTGVAFLKELEVRNITTPVKKVMISGYAAEGEVSEALQRNLIDEFIDKPWTYEGVKDVIGTH